MFLRMVAEYGPWTATTTTTTCKILHLGIHDKKENYFMETEKLKKAENLKKERITNLDNNNN